MRTRESAEIDIKTGRMPETQKRYGLGSAAVRKIANAAGATIRIGRITLYDFDKIDAYLEGLARKQGAEDEAEP